MERALNLDEHESPNVVSPDSTDYTPSPEEEAAIKLVDKLFKKSKKWRKGYDRNWLSDYKFFRGQQWPEQRPSYRHSEVINLIFQSIQATVPMMTDARPKFQFLPQEPSDMKFAEILNKVAESDWIRNNWSMRLTESVYDANIYGTAFGYMGYDDKARKGMGDICFETKDPFHIFPDPNAYDCNVKARFFIEAEPVDVDVLKSDYPEKGKFVKPDLEDLAGGDKTDIDNYYRFRMPLDSTKVMRESDGQVDGYLERKALKKTCYMQSDEVFDEEVQGEDGTSAFQQKLKYPNGRKIVIAGGVVLEDGPNPYDDQKNPYAKLLNYVLPREFYGISDVENLKGPQKIFNKLFSFALDVLTLMGNPIWIVDTDAGIDTDNLINKPGLVVEKSKGSEVRREEGVQLQPYVLQLADRLEQWFNGVSGRSDVSQGLTPGGVTAASAIASLQEAAQTRIRLKSRLVDAYLQDLGQMWLSRTLQFRDAPMIVRISGDQSAEQYFQFHVTPVLDEMGQPMMNERGDMRKKAVIRQVTPAGVSPESQDMEIKGEFDVTVSTGSALPFMKAQKAQDVKDLFDRGVVDQEEVLKTLEWPNYQALMQRMELKAQQQAQMQAEAAQAEAAAKAGGAAPPPLPPEGAPV
jgi:hypothetical protein